MPSATPEQIGREAATSIADAIADGLENILLKLADNIARLSAEQDKQRDEIKALSNRIEALTTRVYALAPSGHGTPERSSWR